MNTEVIAPSSQKIKYGKAPGPTLKNSISGLVKHPLNFIYQSVKEYGSVVRIPMYPHATFIVTNPESVKRILKAEEANYDKQVRTYKKLRMFTGDGIATSTGETWKEHQNLTTPSFHNRYMEGFAENFAQQVEILISQWDSFYQKGMSLDIVPYLHKLSIDIGTKTMLGVDSSNDPALELQEAMGFIFEDGPKRIYGVNPPLWVPTSRNKKTKKAIGVMDDYIYGLINRRLESGEEIDDFLGRLVKGTKRKQGFLVDKQMVRDLTVNFLFGNRETSGNMLVWMFYLLAQNPEADEKLYNEIVTVLGDDVPTDQHLKKMQLPYAMNVVKETLRLYPTAPLLLRRAVKDDVIEGYKIPADSEVILSPFMTHRDPRYWDAPLKFDPDRFNAERIEKVPYFAYFPFGAGGHICPGKNFALLESLIALVMIRRKFKIELVSDPVTLIKEPALFLQPKGPIHVRLVPNK